MTIKFNRLGYIGLRHCYWELKRHISVTTHMHFNGDISARDSLMQLAQITSVQ